MVFHDARTCSYVLNTSYILNTTNTHLQINSETDFVAKNERFRDLVRSVAQTALQSDLPVKTGKCACLLCACLLWMLLCCISLCVARHDIQHQLYTATHCMLFWFWSLMHILSSSVYQTLEKSQICTRVCASHMKSCSGSNEISLDSLAAQAMPSGARCASQSQMFTSPKQLHTSSLEHCSDSGPHLHMRCTAVAHTHEVLL